MGLEPIAQIKRGDDVIVRGVMVTCDYALARFRAGSFWTSFPRVSSMLSMLESEPGTCAGGIMRLLLYSCNRVDDRSGWRSRQKKVLSVDGA